jgi:sec-independent protein translocase protein TatA
VPLAFFSDVGPAELILIFAAILVFFGPRRLPEVARTVGRMMNDLRRASREFQDQIMQIEEESQPSEPSAHPIGPPPGPEPPRLPAGESGEGTPVPVQEEDDAEAKRKKAETGDTHDLAG